MEIKTAHEQQLFNGKNFHVVIYNKTESASGLHQHVYYESHDCSDRPLLSGDQR
jgi:AraC family cel operon transcriptional repressor